MEIKRKYLVLKNYTFRGPREKMFTTEGKTVELTDAEYAKCGLQHTIELVDKVVVAPPAHKMVTSPAVAKTIPVKPAVKLPVKPAALPNKPKVK